MSDKFKKTVAVSPAFVDGEASPAAKFTVLGSQIRVAAEQLEKAIGDVSDQSWPYHASITKRLSPPYGRHRTTGAALGGERFTGITNLARLIGPAANLNPRALTGTTTIVDTVDSGVHEFQLSYPPDDISAVTFSGAGFAYVADPTQLAAASKYSVTAAGKVYFSTATSGAAANRLLTYDVTPTLFGGGQNYSGASFNVIPDPNQTQTGVIADSVIVTGPNAQGVYRVQLPTGTIVAQQSNIKGISQTLGATDLNSDGVMELPEVLSTYTAGDPIPNGFVVLRDNDLNAVYPDATYEYTDQTEFNISGVSLTIANEFSVLTNGTNITSSIDDLRIKQRHNHDGTFGEPGVPITAITGIHSNPGASGAWVPSEENSNHLPQYLHRDGWQSGIDDNFNDQNVMRGPLIIGADNAIGSRYSASGVSHPLGFGNIDTFIQRTVGLDLNYKVVNSAKVHRFLTGAMVSDVGYYGVGGATTVAVPGAVTNEVWKPVHFIVLQGDLNIGTDLGTIDLSNYLPSGTYNVVSASVSMLDTGTTWIQSGGVKGTGNLQFAADLDSASGWKIHVRPDSATWTGGISSVHSFRAFITYTII